MNLRRLALPIQILVSLSLLALLAADFDWQEFLASVSHLSPAFYLWSLALLGVGQLLYVLKWHVIVRSMGVRVGFRRLAEQYFVSLFFNNFLPTNFGGDVAKVFYLGRSVGYVEAGASVFVDRFLSFLCIAAIAAGTAWSLTVSSNEFLAVRGILTALLAALAVVFILLIAFPTRRIAGQQHAIRLFGAARVEAAQRLAGYIRAVARQPRVLATVAVLVAAYYLLVYVVYRAFFHLALGIDMDVIPTLAALTGIALLANLPISVNGIGVREQLHFLMFASMQVSKEAAVAVSIVVFSQLVILSLIGCGVWLRMRSGQANRVAAAAPVLMRADAE